MFNLWLITIFLLIIAFLRWWLTYRNAKDYGIVWDSTRFLDSFTKKDNPERFK